MRVFDMCQKSKLCEEGGISLHLFDSAHALDIYLVMTTRVWISELLRLLIAQVFDTSHG